MEVFEEHVLQHLKVHEGVERTKNGWASRLQHFLLGGAPLAAASTVDM